MKVAIIYGWAEGHWHGHRLRKELKAAGLEYSHDPANADVIIAHSGGCYMLPDNSQANLVMLVGFPYYAGPHPIKFLPKKIKDEFKDLWWLRKTVYNILY